jgi:hypothetical protein
MAVIGQFKGKVQQLIDNLNGKSPNSNTGADRAASEQADRASGNTNPEGRNSRSASSGRESDERSERPSGDSRNAHGQEITDDDFPDGMFDQSQPEEQQQEETKPTRGPVAVQSQTTPKSTRKPQGGGFNF